MFGALMIVGGIAGLAVYAIFEIWGEPPDNYDAVILKTRLDTKKYDGKEYYTYIVTFYIKDENRNISLNVKQKQFDEMVAKDSGILTCCVKKGKFIEWELKNRV